MQYLHIALGALLSGGLFAQGTTTLEQAKSAFRAGRTVEAEQKVSAFLTENPDNLGGLMLKGAVLDVERRYAEAESFYQHALRIAPDSPQVLNNTGNHYMASGNREKARQFYLKTLSVDPHHSNANLQLLDVAAAQFRSEGAQPALRQLDEIPTAARNADYYLLRAQVLDAQDKPHEAVIALNNAIQAEPTRADVYLQASGFLIKHNLLQQANDLLHQASRVLPDDRELLCARVVTLALLRKEPEAHQLLDRIQARWPEWGRSYLLSGMLLENEQKSAEAKRALETAIGLGVNTPEAYYYEALATWHANPDDLQEAQRAIAHALALTSSDPYILVLAGKIAIAQKNYRRAIQELQQAARLKPEYIPTHYALRDAYKAAGDLKRSAAELEEIRRLAKENPGEDQNPFSMENFLFSVRPPA